MSDPSTLGSLVRKRRLESGYSLGQLASKVGKTAAEVRAWERGAELPEHGIIERLASTLEIDLADIRKRLDEGKQALDAERKAAATVAEDEAPAEAETVAEEPETETEPQVKADEVVEFPEEEAVADMAEETEEEEDLPGFPVEDPFTRPPPIDDAAPLPPTVTPSDGAEITDPDLGLLDAPTEPVPVPVITETATAARAGRAAVLLEEPPPPPLPVGEAAPDSDPGLLRYLEPLRILFDPHSRYLYWIRAGLTVVALLILAAILFSRLGALLDAFGELLDTIEPTVADPDDLDALAELVSI